jgi:hypothetical protein
VVGVGVGVGVVGVGVGVVGVGVVGVGVVGVGVGVEGLGVGVVGLGGAESVAGVDSSPCVAKYITSPTVKVIATIINIMSAADGIVYYNLKNKLE